MLEEASFNRGMLTALQYDSPKRYSLIKSCMLTVVPYACALIEAILTSYDSVHLTYAR